MDIPTLLSMLLSVALAVLAAVWGDWMWFIVDLVCLIFLAYPVFRGTGYRYVRGMVAASCVTPIVALVLYGMSTMSDIGGSLLDVNIYSYLIAAVLSYQCFVIGLMFAVVMDRSFGLTMTKAWMLVFAVTFTMCMSALTMFFTYGELYVQGYPVFNDDFTDADRFTNGTIMVSPVMATMVSSVALVWTLTATRGQGKVCFYEEAS